jgi:hypothetical protein
MFQLPPDFNLIDFVMKGGSYCAVLELLAIGWLLRDRSRLLRQIEVLNTHIMDMAERVITVATKIEAYLFRKGGS